MASLALYMVIGLAVGVLGAMVGIGGGIIIVPLLTFVFGFTPFMAVGTSMVVVFMNALSGAIGYIRRHLVCLDAAWRFALATIPGAVLGSCVASAIRGQVFYALFGVFFALFAVNMIWKSCGSAAVDDSLAIPTHYSRTLGTCCSVVVGFLSSILGIGGGVIHVPMMTYLLHFPIKVAVATSTTILAVSALAGASSHAILGHVDWLAAITLGVGACMGAQIGVRLASHTRSVWLIRLCAALILAIGVRFIIECIHLS